MKKVIVVSALFAAVCTTIFSCNNGPYDANPDIDLGSALNPLSGDTAGTNVYIGSMEGRVNNKATIFAPAFYYADSLGIVRIVARIKNDSVFHRTLRISFAAQPEKKTYDVSADTANPVVNFVMLDTSRVDLAGRKIYKTYTANTADGVGYTQIKFTGDEGGHLRGYMFGKLYHFLPEKKFSDTISIEFSNFYFRKVNFPVPAEYKEYLLD